MEALPLHRGQHRRHGRRSPSPLCRRRGTQRAGEAVRRLGARGAGGAGPGARRPLETHRGVAPERRGADRCGRRGCCSRRPPVPAHALGCVSSVLPHRLPGAALHPGGAARRQGLGLRGLGGELVVEGEGLDGQGGGPLVLSVADHRRAAL